MNKFKKIVGITLAMTMVLGVRINTFAVTPRWKNPVPDIPEIHITVPESIKDKIDEMVKDYFNRNPIEVETTETPKITQAIYYHKKLFFNRARLQVQWEEVPETDHYEIRVTKKNGESKIYKDSDTALFVYEGSDDFITECVRSGSIEIRAYGKNGVYSAWSDKKTISCNSLH